MLFNPTRAPSEPYGDVANQVKMTAHVIVFAISSLMAGTSVQAADVATMSPVAPQTSVQWRSDGTSTEIRVLEGSAQITSVVPEISRRSANPDQQPDSDLHPLWHSHGTWVTDIGTLLYNDWDRDGYYTGISLSIDADSEYQHQTVFAVIDITLADGTREHLFTTQAFDLYHHSIGDRYQANIELVRNYPAGHYDLIIDLVDAHDYRILDTVDAFLFRNLSQLPLESENLDVVIDTSPTVTPQPPNDDIRVEEYTGSTGWWTLFLALVAVSWRQRSRLQ